MPDGTKFVWTERVKAPRIFDLNLFAGAFVFKVAIAADNRTSRLSLTIGREAAGAAERGAPRDRDT
ncbi:MAG: hypothetical protein ABI699_16470 [Caldimonas sp.]